MESCPRCEKIKPLCVCGPLPRLRNRVGVCILQHPQEPDKELGSARLASLVLERSWLRTGFSVPNLAKALGQDADPSEWLVLYLGSKYKFRELKPGAASDAPPARSELIAFDREDRVVALDPARVKGLVVIDGTWAQAKALWWRNPWLLKLTRVALVPRARSLYGRLRREPRAECVSTIEAIAYSLEALGEDPAVPEALLSAFAALVTAYRAWQDGPAKSAPGPVPAAPASSASPAAAAPSPGLTRAEKAALARRQALAAGASPSPGGAAPEGPQGAR